MHLEVGVKEKLQKTRTERRLHLCVKLIDKLNARTREVPLEHLRQGAANQSECNRWRGHLGDAMLHY